MLGKVNRIITIKSKTGHSGLWEWALVSLHEVCKKPVLGISIKNELEIIKI